MLVYWILNIIERTFSCSLHIIYLRHLYRNSRSSRNLPAISAQVSRCQWPCKGRNEDVQKVRVTEKRCCICSIWCTGVPFFFFLMNYYIACPIYTHKQNKLKHQLDATNLSVYFTAIVHSTCFGCHIHPSSGAPNMYNQVRYNLITV